VVVQVRRSTAPSEQQPPRTLTTRAAPELISDAGRSTNGNGVPAPVPTLRSRRLTLPGADFDHLTHYLFRFPAKFHPPVASTLIERFTKEGDQVLDPFCGSGTLLVQAAVLGRPSLGMDVDPLAIAVTRAKTHRYRIGLLEASGLKIATIVGEHWRSAAEYKRRQFDDLTEAEYAAELAPVAPWVPAIPNLLHWFRRYVIIDLARLRCGIETADIPTDHRAFFRVVFASIIRAASNADPVPVSGLEVTKWMIERDQAGRIIDPFRLYAAAQAKALDAARAFTAKAKISSPADAFLGDATAIGDAISGKVDAVITSPPYHGAVDYYRRHQLEMYWLGLTTDHSERLTLLNQYVGRPKVPQSHEFVKAPLETKHAKSWESRIRKVSDERADSFHHYMTGMNRFFSGLADHLRKGAPAVLVVGHSDWNGTKIPTTKLFQELAGEPFRLDEVLHYPVKNRYMSYERHNAADISREYVLVLRRR
jgi:hypothetical protein